MAQQKSSSTPSRALAEKPPFAVVAKDAGVTLPAEPVTDSTRDEMIRAMAYAFYEARGCVDGHDLDDWLEAEARVVQAHAQAAPARH